MSERRVAEAVVDVLESAGVRDVFGIPGIHTLPFYDALAGRPSIRHILTRHEQGAAFAADGYARVSARHGVLTTTTGPGSFNTLAAIAEAWSDSSPVVLLAGQIDAALMGQGMGVLHETPDQGRSFEQLTAFVGRPRTPEEVPLAVAGAFRCAKTGRWRPAYVELPTDIIGEPHPAPAPTPVIPGPVAPDPASIVSAARRLGAARRPLLIPGAGVVRGGASRELQALARRLGAPVLTPITGVGTVPGDDPSWAGFLIPGRRSTLDLLAESDAAVVVGCRLDDVETGRWSIPLRGLIQIDVDPSAVGRAYAVDVGIAGDARLALQGLLDELGSGAPTADHGWGTARAAASRQSQADDIPGSNRATRDAFVAARAALPRETIVTHDAARLNAWTGYVWPVYEPDASFFPWGSATLGFALGAANGAAVAAPGRRVVATCGDGGFLFTATELATSVAHSLDVTVLVHDDSGFGSIADYQLKRHGRAYGTSLVNPDLVAFGRSFGIPAERVDDVADLPAAKLVGDERQGEEVAADRARQRDAVVDRELVVVEDADEDAADVTRRRVEDRGEATSGASAHGIPSRGRRWRRATRRAGAGPRPGTPRASRTRDRSRGARAGRSPCAR
jgi:acetolactate synthase-1/2/3 large subunit